MKGGLHCKRVLDPPCHYALCEVAEEHTLIVCPTLHTRCASCAKLGHGPKAAALGVCSTPQRRLRTIFDLHKDFGCHTRNGDVLGW